MGLYTLQDDWRYYKDCYGIEDAVEYMPQEVQSDPIITLALTQLRVAKLAINARVEEM